MLKKRDIQHPGKRSTGTRDKQAEKRDVPAKTGWVATLLLYCFLLSRDKMFWWSRLFVVEPTVCSVRQPSTSTSTCNMQHVRHLNRRHAVPVSLQTTPLPPPALRSRRQVFILHPSRRVFGSGSTEAVAVDPYLAPNRRH